MPKGNRGGKHKTRLIVAASVAATLLIFGLVAIGLFEQAGYQQDAAHNARQYARNAEEKERQSCLGVAANQFAKCLAKARIEDQPEQASYQHDQADLVAQRRAALWAEMMGIAALLGMGLSIVGVVLVWITFRATREGNMIQKRIGEAQTRAYVSVVDASAVLNEHFIPCFTFTIKNSGQSPALKMRLKVTVKFSRIPLEGGKWETFDAEKTPLEIYTVAANDTLTTGRRGIECPGPDYFKFKFLSVLVTLQCTWQDVFGESHTDKGVFARLLDGEWPVDAPHTLAPYHVHVAEIDNEVLKRIAKGEWDKG